MVRNIGQTFYWDEVMNNSNNNNNNNNNVYNPLEWKYVKGDQDSTKQKNGKTYYCCRSHNNSKVHLPEECKASENPNARFQKPAKSKNDNQTAERESNCRTRRLLLDMIGESPGIRDVRYENIQE